MKKYRKRIADEILTRKLEGKGAVLIEGPKWCGKTTTAEQVAASIPVSYTHLDVYKRQHIDMKESIKANLIMIFIGLTICCIFAFIF